MTGHIEISSDGALGRIVLNRPEAINALSRDMIANISDQLLAWRDDAAIAAVLITGNGPKGFCAGGDVRAARTLVLGGEAVPADAYFADEYRMNGIIAGYAKPLVALTHGVVMGGGIGIAGHCRYRITQPGARFAMPEAAIGFFSDVGVNAILAKAPIERALLLLMSGASVGAADAVALGLADVVVSAARGETLADELAIAARSSDPARAIVGLMEAHSIVAGEAPFCALADRLRTGTPASPQAFVAAVAAVPELGDLSALLLSRSPTAITAIFHAQLAARLAMDIDKTLAADLRLAGVMARMPDFAEGVRAVLVDKDQAPKWSPASLEEVDARVLIAAVAAG